MVDPLSNMIKMQQAMLESWINCSTQMMQYWQHLAAMQERLINQTLEYGRGKVVIDDGPSFTGKYGKRRHDIDPEHDV
jgi:hypothetical protein